MPQFRIIIFFTFVCCANCAKILGVFPMPGVSHYILSSKLMRGLAEAGHDVTVISPYELKDLPKNGRYTDVILDGLAEDFQMMLQKMNLYELDLRSPLEKMRTLTNTFIQNINKTLNHPKVKKLIESDETFDAVIMEQFSNDALKVFSHIYQCPLIILSSNGPQGWVNPTVGNPQPVACTPHLLNRDLLEDPSLLSRGKNLMFYLLDYLMTTFYTHPMHDEIMHQAFPDAPSLYDLYTNVSLVLLNSHTSTFRAVPLVPNMVEVGGYFIDVPRKLPKDLQDFLDGAEEGAIYFSMGSNLKSQNIPEKKRKAILSVLGNLKQKILWKFEVDLPDQPPNVLIRKWLPQQDILAHPNVKLFITHGGLLSTTETIYHGVPILALPVFADQPANADRAVASGYGLKLGFNDPDFNEETFGSLVNELLKNPKYGEDAKRRSKIYHDRPQKPMDAAVYWVEYVIRHKGAPHLRVAGIKLPWYKYFMVDVIEALVLSILITFYSIGVVINKLFCNNNKFNQSKKKLKNK